MSDEEQALTEPEAEQSEPVAVAAARALRELADDIEDGRAELLRIKVSTGYEEQPGIFGAWPERVPTNEYRIKLTIRRLDGKPEAEESKPLG